MVWRTIPPHRFLLPFLGITSGAPGIADQCMVSPWMEKGTIISYIDELTTQPEVSSALLTQLVDQWVSLRTNSNQLGRKPDLLTRYWA